MRPLISKIFPHLGWSHHRRSSKNYGNSSSEGAHTHYTANGNLTDNRKTSNADSERTFVNTSHVLHTEDLALKRINSEGDFSDGVYGLEDLKMKQDLEASRSSGESARGHHKPPQVAPPIPPMDKSARLLGLEPTIKTEIKASTPEPADTASRVPDHGITVHRDVVIRGLSDRSEQK
jgi:hypothetical protein